MTASVAVAPSPRSRTCIAASGASRPARARRCSPSTVLLAGSTAVKLSLPWMAAQAINSLQGGADGSVRSAALWVVAILARLHRRLAAARPRPRARAQRRRARAPGRLGRALCEADAGAAGLARAPAFWRDPEPGRQASHGLYEFAQSQFIYLQSTVNFVGPVVALALLSTATGWIALGGYVVVAAVILRFDRALIRLATRENQAERRYAAGLLDFLGNISTVLSLRLQRARGACSAGA